MTAPQDESKKSAKAVVRTHTPRPDELTRETFEFIAAVDHYKRTHMRSFLNDGEVLEILFSLGYRRAGAKPGVTAKALKDFGDARKRYRVEQGRLFPTWSELFELLSELGYERAGENDAA